MCYLRSERLSEAERLVKDLQRACPNAAELSFLMGLIHAKKGDTNQALKDLKKAVKQDPHHTLAHYFIGEIYMGQKKWKEAAAAYQRSAADP